MASCEDWLRLYESMEAPLQKRALYHLLVCEESPDLGILLDAFERLFAAEWNVCNPDLMTRALRRAVIHALAARAEKARAAATLLPYLTHADPRTRAAACEVLRGLRACGAIEHLVRRLADPIPYVRCEAAYALGDLGDPSASMALEARFVAAPPDRDEQNALRYALAALGARPLEGPAGGL